MFSLGGVATDWPHPAAGVFYLRTHRYMLRIGDLYEVPELYLDIRYIRANKYVTLRSI